MFYCYTYIEAGVKTVKHTVKYKSGKCCFGNVTIANKFLVMNNRVRCSLLKGKILLLAL